MPTINSRWLVTFVIFRSCGRFLTTRTQSLAFIHDVIAWHIPLGISKDNNDTMCVLIKHINLANNTLIAEMLCDSNYTYYKLLLLLTAL